MIKYLLKNGLLPNEIKKKTARYIRFFLFLTS